MQRQSSPEGFVVPQDVADCILCECLGRPQGYRMLGRLCDEIGPRSSGTEGGERAEQWAYSRFQQFGLKEVRFEEVPLTVWERGTVEAGVAAPAPYRVTALSHGNAPQYAHVEAPLVDLGHGDREDFVRMAGEIGGAVVLCDEGVPEGHRKLHRSEQLALAAEYGAAALLIMSSAAGLLPRTGVCHASEAPIPSAGISLEDGERLRRLLNEGVRPRVRIAMKNLLHAGCARNVIADLPGTSSADEILLCGAHLDAWDVAQGALDNGLGVAIVLEMARVLALVKKRPKRTIRFALWAAEEVGLLGSKQYARNHQSELPRHSAVMNFDMTGEPQGYWTPGAPAKPAVLEGLAEQLSPLGMTAMWDNKPGLHSDHQPFMLEGLPVVCISGRLPHEAGRYYHSQGDTFDKVDCPSLCRAAAVAACTAWALADLEGPPYPRKQPCDVAAMMRDAGLEEALAAEGYVLKD
ncbi:MAG: M28 family peptidase [Chthonomonadales bacterium]